MIYMSRLFYFKKQALNDYKKYKIAPKIKIKPRLRREFQLIFCIIQKDNLLADSQLTTWNSLLIFHRSAKIIKLKSF